MRQIYFLFFLLVVFTCYSQKKSRIEKLEKKIAVAKDDTNKINDLIILGRLTRREDYAKANAYYAQAFNLSNKLNYISGKIGVFNARGDYYWYQTNYDKAFEYYFKAYRLNDSIHNERGLAESLYNLGWIGCIQQHNYGDDKYLYKSLQITQKLGDAPGLRRACNALSSYYNLRYEDSNKKQFFDSSVKYTNIGIESCKKDKAYENLAVFYINFGDLLYSSKDFRSSKFHVSRAMEIYRERKDSMNLVFCISRNARCDAEIGDVNSALKTLQFVIDYSKKNKNKELEMETLLMLSNAFQKAGKCNESFEAFKTYSAIKEELDKKAFVNSISNLESNFSLEKAEVSMNELRQNNEIQELKSKKKNYFILVLVVIGLVVIVVAFLLFRQNKLKQLTNLQLKEQNQIIIEKKQEIDHSIQYAKGIQLAILPDLKELKEQFAESFVYYKPKDVVSGDFYWFGKVDTSYYCLVADCTGHGVPGALMSIIGMD
jgi:tetratricopeptide (TPR) repeat protein